MNKDVPAWMVCDEILTKTKDELVLEAIDILHEEIKHKRIDIKGFEPLLPDRPKELERDLFIINNIIAKIDDVRGQYKDYMNINSRNPDPKNIERAEELGKFLNSVNAISMLMSISKIFSSWAEDTGRHAAIKSPVDIMLRTLLGNDERLEALKFTVASSTFKKNEALSDDEMDVLADTLAKVTNTPHVAS